MDRQQHKRQLEHQGTLTNSRDVRIARNPITKWMLTTEGKPAIADSLSTAVMPTKEGMSATVV